MSIERRTDIRCDGCVKTYKGGVGITAFEIRREFGASGWIHRWNPLEERWLDLCPTCRVRLEGLLRKDQT